MREDQSLSQCLTLGAEDENDATHRHVIADLIRNPEVKGRAYNKPTPTAIPLSLDGRGPKPVPVPDTGAEGEQVKNTPM